LYLTAKCGTPLREIEAALAERGQCLAFEPPRFAPESTIGGVVAAGPSGPRRANAGAVRDFVLGVKILDGQARELSFGGQGMKNVAGYDVSRLMAGSLGTLGLILEVTLKVLPQPAAEATLRFAVAEDEALERMNRWAGQPLPIVASCWHAGVLTLKLAGARAAVEAAADKLGGERGDAAGNAGAPAGDAPPGKVGAGGTAFWQALRDQTVDFFQGEPLWRLSVPSSAPPLALPGEQWIEWGGALRWLKTDAPAEALRAAAAAAGGHATLYRAPAELKRRVGAFAPLPAALMKLHQNLKAAFDPRGIFNPGRLYPEL
ncbi:MAG: glycolate oxidase subunit GlcE, partial [Rhodocyclaceae bacterium]|nr:glycolate oxidase subunit GlcE [Rhodocyclaceae bacterium]